AQLPRAIRPGGYGLLEFGDGQEREVAEMARAAFPNAPLAVWRDLSWLPRVLQIGPVRRQ
ncbi:MAG: peptide chain release factor N(5)-glutamine methyltransferase, partial [Chloroflexia bacterium]